MSPIAYDNSASVLLQLNTGALGNNMNYTSGVASGLRYVVAVDMNNDTKLDIVVANYGSNNVGVLLGYGNGFFHESKDD